MGPPKGHQNAGQKLLVDGKHLSMDCMTEMPLVVCGSDHGEVKVIAIFEQAFSINNSIQYMLHGLYAFSPVLLVVHNGW